MQDVRGRFTSEGEFYTFINEINDGYDSIEWLASSRGARARSAHSAYLMLARRSGSPPSRCRRRSQPSRPASPRTTTTKAGAWQGGAFELGFNLSWSIGALSSANWANLSQRINKDISDVNALITSKDALEGGFSHLPMQELPDLKEGIAPYYYDWLAHSDYDDYWKQVCIAESHSEIAIPAFNVGGWYDIFLGGTIGNYLGMRANGASEAARNGQRLLIGPWIHSGVRARSLRRVQLRHPRGSSGNRSARRVPALLRPPPEGRGQRRARRPARPHIRDGRQRVAL